METAYGIACGPSSFDLAVSMWRGRMPGDPVRFEVWNPREHQRTFYIEALILGADIPFGSNGRYYKCQLRGLAIFPKDYQPKPSPKGIPVPFEARFEAEYDVKTRTGNLEIISEAPDKEEVGPKLLPDFQSFVGGKLLCKTLSGVPGVGKKWIYGKIKAVEFVRKGGIAFKFAHWPTVFNEKHPQPRASRVTEPFWIPTEGEGIEIINLDFTPTPTCLIINEKAGDITIIFGPEKK